ncbi:MAG: tetratricopeptide repeat protein [Planctomycetes bacterium]|nr:tetratricopeptide repeat protein [Planctomycetota bacterium]
MTRRAGAVLVLLAGAAALFAGWYFAVRTTPANGGGALGDGAGLGGEGPAGAQGQRGAHYLGAQACAECHAERAQAYMRTPHFLSSRLPDPDRLVGVPLTDLGGKAVMRTRRKDLRFELEERDGAYSLAAVTAHDGKEDREEVQIAFVIGSGHISNSYAFWRGKQLFQAPVGYVAQLGGLANCPGYVDGTALFDRPIITRCLDCHATYAKHESGTLNSYAPDSFVLGISCERCHGPGSAHAAWHRAHPNDKPGRHIVQPQKLSRSQRLEQCAQCHGDAGRLIQPAFTYLPGDPLSEYVRQVSPRLKGKSVFLHTADQDQRMKLSKCFQGSERLECISCHDPHAPQADTVAVSKRECLKCHQPEACGEARNLPEGLRGDCVQCHMPRRSDLHTTYDTPDQDYLHLIQLWEHKIGIHPDGALKHRLLWQRTRNDPAMKASTAELEARFADGKLAEAGAYMKERKYIEAISVFRELLALNPAPVPAAAAKEGLAEALVRQRAYDEALALDQNARILLESNKVAEAEAQFRKALERSPGLPHALVGLGSMAAAQERYDEALAIYRKALERDPEYAEALGGIGAVLARTGHPEEARASFRRSLASNPDDETVRTEYGNLLLQLGEADAAVEEYREALRLDPKRPDVHHNLAVIAMHQKDIKEAVVHLKEEVRLDPKRTDTADVLAWLLATHPEAAVRDGKTAVDLARRCVEADPKRARYHDTLGAALAETGAYEEAATAATRAQALAGESGDDALAEQIAARAKLYAQRKPYRP